MKRLISTVAVLSLTVGACSASRDVGAPIGGPSSIPASPATAMPSATATPTPCATSGGSPSAPWTQADLPAVDDLLTAAGSGRVVLVAADGVLDVRCGAGAGQPIVGTLAPRAVVALTGATDSADGGEWVEIIIPDGTGWVDGYHLGANVDVADFNGSEAVTALLDRLAAVMAAGGDLTEVVSRRGLSIAHNAPFMHFAPDVLPGLLASEQTYQWGSAALEPGSPELPHRTFAQAVGDRFVSAYSDGDTSVRWNEVELGGNGIRAEDAVPFELRGFNVVSVYDPGDDPQYGGLDWTAWYVSIDDEGTEPVVVAMTLNEWTP